MSKRFFLLFLPALFFVIVIAYAKNETGWPDTVPLPKTSTIVRFRNIAVRAEIADTHAGRSRGLSGRMPRQNGGGKRGMEVEGMWFDFIVPGIHGIWMKEMSFPLDILWFDEGFRLVHMKENAEPSSYPEVFEPSSPARYVLEVPAGFAEKYHISFGEKVFVQNAD